MRHESATFEFAPIQFRVKDAADYAGLSESRFLTAVKNGLLPKPRKPGGKIRFWLRTEIDEALGRTSTEYGWIRPELN